MKILRFYKLFTFTSISLVCFATSGCGAGLEEVEEFGTTSAAVKVASDNIAEDIYNSCERKAKKYQESSIIFPNARVFNLIQKNLADCEDLRSDEQIIKDANAILVDYMVNLGRLASNDTVSFDRNLDQLRGALQGARTSLEIPLTGEQFTLPEEQFNAGLTIVEFIFDRLTLKFRRDNIKRAILCANNEIHLYKEGLNSIVQDYYIEGTLKEEISALDGYYTDFVTNPGEQSAKLEPHIFRRDYVEDLEIIIQKKRAGEAYIALINTTADTHNKLKDEFNDENKTDKQLVEDCEKDLAEDVANADIQKDVVVEGDSFSPAEIKRIEKILVRHHEQIQPLLLQIEKAFPVAKKK